MTEEMMERRKVSPPKRKKRLLTKQKILILVVLGLILSILGSIWGAKELYNYLLSAPSEDGTTYPFVIEAGETVATIAQNLEEGGFIRNDLFFRWWALKEGLVIEAGEYTLAKNIPLPSLAQALTHGIFDTQVTIIEGWRREEIIDYLYANKLLPEVTKKEKKKEAQEEFLSRTKEGFLFPDTYNLSKESTLDDLINFMSENFWLKFDSSLRQEVQDKELSYDEVVILASIIEREVNSEEDRPIVAGILIKRWENDWSLEADATVQYAKANEICQNSEPACNWWPNDLTEEDLKIDSPYNTRENKSLPPGAICNPSLSSLKAVIYPQESDYWYYLTDEDGVTHYALTLEEHNQNIAQYL